jgi:hypothetical protein
MLRSVGGKRAIKKALGGAWTCAGVGDARFVETGPYQRTRTIISLRIALPPFADIVER